MESSHFSVIVNLIDEKRFSRTLQGQRRIVAEDLFDKSNDEPRLSSCRIRPLNGNDGSTIVTIDYGNAKYPGITCYRFTGDSMEPQKISIEEAEVYENFKIQ